MIHLPFLNRFEAGWLLAAALAKEGDQPGVIVVALPRGGVPVGFEIARALYAPLDVLPVRKLGMPGHRELGIGAIAAGGVKVLDEAYIKEMNIPADAIERVAAEETQRLAQQEHLFRLGPKQDLSGRTVILVDDGLATGWTMRAAVKAARKQGAARVVVAVPVCSRQGRMDLSHEADEVVCLATPDPFFAVGAWYEDFSQTSDEEVRNLLSAAVPSEVR